MTPINDNDWIVTFIRDYLPHFPDDILIQVFDKLTFEHLIDVFWYFENIQDLLIRHYYSRKICFTFSEYRPTEEPIWSNCDPKQDELVTFGKFDNTRGMYIVTKVVPQKLVLTSGNDFKEVKNILTLDCIRNIPEIEIIIQKVNLTTKEFYNLISLPNLVKLHLLNMDINCITPISRDDYLAISNHKKLTEIACLRFRGMNDWSKIEFPQGLTSLALWRNGGSDNVTDSSTSIIPQSLQRLDFRDINISFKGLLHTPHLTLLRLISYSLTTIIVDELPIGLHKLNLLSNTLISISGKTWPPNLHDISLCCPMLGDNGFETFVNTVGWPEHLISLDISCNRTSRIDYLKLLPPSLQKLDISGNPFIWPDEQGFEFPNKLKTLQMSGCQLKVLQYIKFPKSLEKLDLHDNQISDILSYYDWSTVTNLRILDLSRNLISSFDNWMIPGNVFKLYLGGNPINTLTSKFPLFNSDYIFHVFELELKYCNLTTLEIDYIPPSLKRLDLSSNKLPKAFVFPSILKRLSHLDLAGNELTSIEFDEKDDVDRCLLCLDLSYNFIGEEPRSEGITKFYNNLEKNLGKLKHRYNEVNRLHVFERCYSS